MIALNFALLVLPVLNAVKFGRKNANRGHVEPLDPALLSRVSKVYDVEGAIPAVDEAPSLPKIKRNMMPVNGASKAQVDSAFENFRSLFSKFVEKGGGQGWEDHVVPCDSFFQHVLSGSKGRMPITVDVSGGMDGSSSFTQVSAASASGWCGGNCCPGGASSSSSLSFLQLNYGVTGQCPSAPGGGSACTARESASGDAYQFFYNHDVTDGMAPSYLPCQVLTPPRPLGVLPVHGGYGAP